MTTDQSGQWGMAIEIDGVMHTIYVRLLPPHLRVEGKSPFECTIDSFPSKDVAA